MTLTASQQKVQDAYQSIFGRDASFGTLGGADYWTDQIDNNSLSDSELDRILKASAEGQSNIQNGVLTPGSGYLGGVNPNLSIAQNIANDASAVNPEDKSWASHFTDGGVFASTDASGNPSDLSNTIWAGMTGAGDGTTGTTQNVAGLLNATYNANNPNSTLPNPYYNNAPIIDDGTGPNIPTPTVPTPVVPTPTTPTTPTNPTGNWYDGYASGADWLAANPQGGSSSTGGGMDDFMKFMMLMSVMGGQGGGGYGGSQYGYGGLNPGGVMQAYDPLAQLQGMGTWFKDNFGSGGATTSTVNTGTT